MAEEHKNMESAQSISGAPVQKNIEDGSIFFHNGKAFCKYNLEDQYCSAGWSFFQEGLPYFINAYKKDSTNAEVCFKLGMTYYASANKYNAIPFVCKAYQLNPAIDPGALFYAARLHHLNKDWETALGLYHLLLKEKTISSDTKNNVTNKDVLAWIDECKTAATLPQGTDISITPMGSTINTPFPEYGSALLANGNSLLFSSKRDTIDIDRNFVVYEEESEKIESIYLSYKRASGWSNGIKLPAPINSDESSSAVLAVSSDNTEILIKKNGDIYRTVFINGQWDDLEAVEGEINSSAQETSASFSNNEDSIFFTSTRKNGLGSNDIYIATLNENKQVESVANLGSPVNTKYNEEAVFFHKRSKTLFFSSDRPGTIGGYDIFFTQKKIDGTWTVPQNIGLPLNSPEDDLFFNINDSFTKGFITSYRQNTFGEMDIYEIYCPRSFSERFYNSSKTTNEPELTKTDTVIRPKDSIKITIAFAFSDTLQHIVQYKIHSENFSLKETTSEKKLSITIPRESFYTIRGISTGYFETQEKLFVDSNSKTIELPLVFNKQKHSGITIIDNTEAKDSILFEGIVIEAETGATNQEAIIQLFDSTTNTLIAKTTANARTGKYRLSASPRKSYKLSVVSESHLNQSNYIAIPAGHNTVSIKNKLLKKNNPILCSMEGKEDMEIAFETQKTVLIENPGTNGADSMTIEVVDYQTGTLVERHLLTKEKTIRIFAGRNYSITVKADGYATTQYLINIPVSSNKAILSPELKKQAIKKTSSYIGAIFFASNSAQVDSSYFTMLASAMRILKSDRQVSVSFVGHTDAIGSESANADLSYRRAHSCSQIALERYGISQQKINTEFKGETAPIGDNNSNIGRAKNRRVDVFINY